MEVDINENAGSGKGWVKFYGVARCIQVACGHLSLQWLAVVEPRYRPCSCHYSIHPDLSDAAILQPDEFTIKTNNIFGAASGQSTKEHKLEIFDEVAADVSDQREMDQEVHVSNSSDGAHGNDWKYRHPYGDM